MLLKMGSLRLCLPVWLLALLLAASLTEGFHMVNRPRKCCFDFAAKQLSRRKIVSYSTTSQQCTKGGILFRTLAGREVCARPSDKWVQDYVKFFDGKSKPSRI
ncbi:monocyte chemotactic protein 1B-like [Lepisosteus oculatus]|uniref:monocyte chemotactic protein 1B-like n=1 Tax=Lepisosteus oculatus TaxID=7918 RepID=UPI0035F52FC1